MSAAYVAHPANKGKNLPQNKYAANAAQSSSDAKHLHKALKEGWFTNEEGVFSVLCKRTSAQIADIRVAYDAEFKGSLLDDVKKETGGNFEDLLKALVMTPAEYDAYRIFRACDGIGTNEEQLIEILAHREPYEVRAFNEAYQKLYNMTAHARIEKEVSGELGMLFSNLSDPRNERKTPANEAIQIKEDVKQLFEASQDKLVGHDAVPFIRILSQNNYDYIRKVYAAYTNAHGKTLEHIINGWALGGQLAKALLAIVTPPDEYYSNLLFSAMKGVGTDEHRLIRIVVQQRERYLAAIADHFVHQHKKALKEWVKDETRGDFKSALVALLEFYAEIKA